jgi:hypothetical protein
MTKLPLENIVTIETDERTYNNIAKVEERTFDGRPFLLITHESGSGHAVETRDVKEFEYCKKESKIKTQKDVLEAWKLGNLIEV